MTKQTKRRRSHQSPTRRYPKLGRGRKTIRQVALAFFAFGFLWTGLMKGASTFPSAPSTGEPLELVSMVPDSPIDLVNHVLDGPLTITNEPDDVAWDLPNLHHDRVDYWVEQFTTNKRDDFGRFLQRKGKYEPMIRQKLAERGMPQDLLYLAMIESGFQEKAYSPAHAAGLWQFMAPTGKQYGLDINRAVDERNDPEKATDAALDYLAYLHKRFDSWYLAAASYNTGPNRVGRIMRKVTGSERGPEESYYRIWDHLPAETRDYVPLMVAAARISKEPEKYGFGHIEPLSPPKAIRVKAAPATPLSVIARRNGTTVTEIRNLNPHLKLDRTRNDMTSEIRVPAPVEIASR